MLLAGCVGCDGAITTGPQTVKLASGPTTLVGSDNTGCSNGVPGDLTAPDRWCAFARRAGDGTELWVIDVSRAVAGLRPAGDAPRTTAAPFRCDGSSPHCRRLTATLWTGQPVFARSHPYIHGFEGDTLVYYADAVGDDPESGYVGPVQAWRPELPGPVQVTGPAGFECLGHRGSDGVLCLENLQTGQGDLTFELLAGKLSLAGRGPLPFLAPVRPEDAREIPLWDVRFSPDGQHLLLSTWAPDALVQRLQLVETARIGRAQPVEVLRNLVSWRLSPDGSRLFYLDGLDPAEGGNAMGTLKAVDFPSLANPTTLQPRVGRYDIHGPSGQRARSATFLQDVKDSAGVFRAIPDLAKPDQVVTIAQNIEEARVSPDGRFSLYYDFDEQGDLLSMLARNDGSSRCLLNAKHGHPAFGLVFPTGVDQVFWGEDSDEDIGRNEGHFADPNTCQVKHRFSSRLAYLEATREGIVFGEEQGNPPLAMSLFRGRVAGQELAKEEIAQGADTTVVLIDQRWLVFTVSRGADDELGLYVYGPIP